MISKLCLVSTPLVIITILCLFFYYITKHNYNIIYWEFGKFDNVLINYFSVFKSKPYYDKSNIITIDDTHTWKLCYSLDRTDDWFCPFSLLLRGEIALDVRILIDFWSFLKIWRCALFVKSWYYGWNIRIDSTWNKMKQGRQIR